MGGGGAQPQLNTVSLSRSGSTVVITNPSSNGNFVKSYKIYDGETLLTEQTSKSLDISGLEFGAHMLTAIACGNNFIESAKSNVLNASKYTVTLNLVDITSNYNSQYVWHGDALTIMLTPNEGMNLPNDIEFTMGGVADVGMTFDSGEGVISIPNVSGNIVISAQAHEPSMADDSWELIASRAKAGTAKDYYKLGEEKTVDLTYADGTTETITMVLAAFDQDELQKSGVAAMTFVAKELLATLRPLVTSDSTGNLLDYSVEGNLGYWVRNELFSALPSALQQNICAVKRRLFTSGNGVADFYEKVWLPSFKNIGLGDKTEGYVTYRSNGSTYPIFDGVVEGDERLIKYRVGSDTSEMWHAEGRWYYNYSSYNALRNVAVSVEGKMAAPLATAECGVCFGFCL